jgi:hypothetical protein
LEELPLPNLADDLKILRQEIAHLQQEIDRQHHDINQIRRQLPRGWYRRSNSTSNLEIQPAVENQAIQVKISSLSKRGR